MKAARRLDSLPIYVFALLDAKLKAARAQGIDIIKLDIGSPDGPPAAGSDCRNAGRAAGDPTRHGYAGYFGTPRLRQADGGLLRTRFGVSGPGRSQRGLAADRFQGGDREYGVGLAGSGRSCPGARSRLSDVPDERCTWSAPKCSICRLLAENGFLPGLDAIPSEVAQRARLMWLNYPNNPTGAIAPLSFFEEAVDFCRRHVYPVAVS